MWWLEGDFGGGGMGYSGGGGGGRVSGVGRLFIICRGFTLSKTQNYAPVTPRVIRVCFFFITVKSLPIVSVKRTKMRKCKTVRICPALHIIQYSITQFSCNTQCWALVIFLLMRHTFQCQYGLAAPFPSSWQSTSNLPLW